MRLLKTKAWCGTIKIPSFSKVNSAEERLKFGSPSPTNDDVSM